MIKTLSTNDQYLNVINDYHNVPPISPGAQSAGMLRWNTNTSAIEVYNGIAWFPINTDASVNLTPIAQQAMTWAIDKMKEEERLKDLMARHPGLKDLNDKFEMMKALCLEEERHK